MDNFTDFTTVQYALGGDVILVGEEHRNGRCAELCERVIDTEDPGTLAAERCAGQRDSRSGAMGAIFEYAKRRGLPYVRVDGGHNFRDVVDSRAGFLRDANRFTHPIQEDGDLNEKAIHNNRQLVYEIYGEEASRRLHDEREDAMARYLRWAAENMPTPVLCALGTFHILAVAERLETGAATSRPTGNRLMNYTVTEPTETSTIAG